MPGQNCEKLKSQSRTMWVATPTSRNQASDSLKLMSDKKPPCTKYVEQQCISKQETEEAMWP